MLTFRTSKNPSFRFITRPGLTQNPKRLLISTFRTFNPGFRQNINLFFKDHGLFLFLLLNDYRAPLLLFFLSTGVTDKKLSLWKHQHFTLWAKLHVTPSGMHPLRSSRGQMLKLVTRLP